MSDNQAEPERDYACAVGSAILALNELESNVFYLLQILDASHSALEVEKESIKDKIKRLKKESLKHVDAKVRARLDKVVSETCRLANERNNFAHGFLWTDAFTGEHKHRLVRQRDGQVLEGARLPPEAIEGIAFDLNLLAADVKDLANELGGLERWEKYVQSLNT
jgi:hypothetical protein